MRITRVYTDTSVFGGVFDKEFDSASQIFFKQVRLGIFDLVTSAVVKREIERAPDEVKRFYQDIVTHSEIIEISEESRNLQRAYLQAGIVSPTFATDALHVALATVAGCSLIVSWNFKHIVHFQKIRMYNAVNLMQGYKDIFICSPMEVIDHEE